MSKILKVIFFIAMIPFMVIVGSSIGFYQVAELALTHNKRKRREAEILKEWSLYD